ncbi:lactose synthase [Trifolium repens]|nr:putative glycosyltransferase [Trifolium repens]WJX77655.1 lactose synthase [Trifolium repens]
MFRSSSFYHYSHNHVPTTSFKKSFFFFIPTTLALLTSLFILFYVYSTSIIFTHHHHHHKFQPILHFKSSSSNFTLSLHKNHSEFIKSHTYQLGDHIHGLGPQSQQGLSHDQSSLKEPNTQKKRAISFGSKIFEENKNVFHDRDYFLEDYKDMNRSFKIYVYPHKENDPFANVLLPVKTEPGGNYASESYFKKALMKSHFITNDPTEADLFFMPFSIASLRHDRRVGVGGIKDFIRDYVQNIIHKYPYWNRTGGADHFYVACHSIGRSAMDKAPHVKFNAIQVVCSSSYFLSGYIAHKDACLPQIWPRKENLPKLVTSNRRKLAFFAGAANSVLRRNVVETWKNDSEIFVHNGRLKTPYADELLGSKFCLHVKGFEVNTARIGDSLYYGCVPVIIAEHYDLPFADVLNWKSFSVVVTTLDIPLLKKILKSMVNSGEYLMLQRNVLKVRKHFQWHSPPLEFDSFYMVMYELWLRRSSIPILLGDSLELYH